MRVLVGNARKYMPESFGKCRRLHYIIWGQSLQETIQDVTFTEINFPKNRLINCVKFCTKKMLPRKISNENN